ncbi:MAG: Hsp20/alpha crystallin family protein [Lachnospiraceae bacterium]|nr:Hsp20/alpha crystallin family protein [Lachnospiraceae bacterium]MBR4994195.1 Hsp20/alpha crystallin family protein [Lachnospiraceae bacterium]MBR5944755.1 Hsp20/alpha crystallin family protein [Lachnospiraceae bacterium]
MLMPSIFGENLFDNFFDDLARPALGFHHQNEFNPLMKTDVKEHKDRFELSIDVPGVKKEDLSAELENGYLTITATRNDEKEEKNKEGEYIRRERYTGSTSRSFYVGEDVKQEDIKAKFDNGTLKLTIPKVEAKPEVKENKYIAIEG